MGNPLGESALKEARGAGASGVQATPAPTDAQLLTPSPGPADALGTKLCPSCQVRYPVEYRVCPRDATPLTDVEAGADPMLGSTLAGSYEVIRVIGEGAMGRVYEARHTRLRAKRYAVKLLHQDLARHRDVISRFRGEAEASAAITHPNVIDVYDVNTTPAGLPYIVAEYLEGQELAEYLAKTPRMNVSEAIPIMRQVCRALAAAHAQGIVHRDVKPENIYLLGGEAPGSTPFVKVLDFGISKVLEGEANLTKTGVIIGTPAFMAPEQARGERVGLQADIYSAGAVFYRMLTGSCPFEGLDQMATLTAVMTRNPPRPSSLVPTIPSALEMVIQRAMAKAVEARYATMEEFDAALRPFDRSAADGRTSVADVETPVESLLTEDLAVVSTKDAVVMRQTEREIRAARPRLIVLSAVGWLGLGGLFLTAAGSMLSLTRGDTSSMSRIEMTMVIVGGFGLLLTPGIWWWRYVHQAWDNTPACVELSDRMRKALLAGGAAYGLSFLLIRVFALVVERHAPTAQPLWELGFVGVALASAALSWIRTNPRRAAP